MNDARDGDLARSIREQAPRVLAALTRRAGDFALAEDAVQEALIAAAEQWPRAGSPANPGGWLYQVAARRLADALDAAAARARREAEVAAERGEAHEPGDSLPEDGADETLELFFLCCHPSLEDAAAVALVLRALGGLTTAEIASAFFVSEATMAQRITRAKQAIRASKVPFPARDAAERDEGGERLNAVLHVLYLVFNEGHTASSASELVRVDLCAEAIRLARLVHARAPEHPEAAGLLALLLLTDARRAARTGPAGELVPLHEQERERWDRAAIREGTELLAAALARGAVGAYQVQAAIAALHDEASSLAATDWPQILALYGLLARFADNPAVALNRVVALAMVEGPRAGLDALAELERDPRLAPVNQGHRLDAVRAHLLERAGERAEAERHYRAAAERASNLAERRYLEAKADAVRGS